MKRKLIGWPLAILFSPVIILGLIVSPFIAYFQSGMFIAEHINDKLKGS